MVDLAKVVKTLKKDYSSTSVAEDIIDPKDFVTTGNIAFDLISDGGVPFGYVIEFLGLSQSGKSLYIHKLIANAQRDYNAVGILIDRENAYFKARGKQLGINNKDLLLAKPVDTPTPTTAFQFIIDSVSTVRKQEIDEAKEEKGKKVERSYIVIGIDSISAFGKDVALDKSDSGRKAKAVHEGLREILSIIDDRIMIIVANQVTFKIGILFGDPKTSTAGESMKYYSTIRFALEDRKKIIDTSKGNEVIGNWLGVEAIKTRLGPCWRQCYLPHYYKTGIDPYGGYARLLASRGFLTPTNKDKFKSFSTHTLAFGKGKTIEKVNEFEVETFLKKHPELLFKEYPEYYEEEKEEEVVVTKEEE